MKHSITTKMVIHGRRNYDGQIDFSLYYSDMSQYGETALMEKDVTVEFELPDDFDLTTAEVEALKKQKQQVQAEAQVRINLIDEKIQRLLCIEHKESA